VSVQWPAYCNSISDFDFHFPIVIGILFCIAVLNFVQIATIWILRKVWFWLHRRMAVSMCTPQQKASSAPFEKRSSSGLQNDAADQLMVNF